MPVLNTIFIRMQYEVFSLNLVFTKWGYLKFIHEAPNQISKN